MLKFNNSSKHLSTVGNYFYSKSLLKQPHYKHITLTLIVMLQYAHGQKQTAKSTARINIPV